MINSHFSKRHIGPSAQEQHEMLNTIGVKTIDELIDQTVPKSIRINRELDVPEGITEYQYANHIASIGAKNKLFRSYIGMGYYGTIVPTVIQRNILENPGWYTAYTPYQAEISQGRLEALLNYQTMIMDLTGMEIANASLLDEATAAAEGMIMLYNSRSREQAKADVKKFFVSQNCFPQTIDVIKTRAFPLGIELEIGDEKTFKPNADYFGFAVQYPDKTGAINDFSELIAQCKTFECKSLIIADIMALVMLKTPSEMGADVVVGSTQRFGVPMGFGGPHAAYFATKDEFKRNIPGRIIGVSLDRNGNRALRMALQTREQHIKRDKATSNICTAQALLAIMASMYAVYHGSDGLKEIAATIHEKTVKIYNALKALGYKIVNDTYFDTLTITTDKLQEIKAYALAKEINFNYISDKLLSITIDQTVQEEDLNDIIEVLALGKKFEIVEDVDEVSIPSSLHRTTSFLEHKVFNSYHSETEMMRYLKSLENKDISLVHSMISLGSCTMKLNAASELYPITKPEFCNMHPFVPKDQAAGYAEIFKSLEKWLADITGFDAVSFQPNSGAQGEYAGMLVIQAYHRSRGEGHRNISLIPSSAHGTNPATAVMAGTKVVVVKCDENGNIDVADLKAKAEEHKDNLSSLLVTYPSTHGVFEESIIEITDIIHANGGQVYMDGANMNAQVGITNPGKIGADVCHLNLHKTFAIPHGGGGPGVGPIGVAKHLTPFLPGHTVVDINRGNAINAVSAAPYGSALILLISYGYIRMLGKEGLLSSTEHAILNANYLKTILEKEFDVLYQGGQNRVAHEMILDCREFKKTAKIEVEDIAKRLIDYGFHAPTVSFPVAGTLMVEPTESESKEELDRFAAAMISIKKEIDEIQKSEIFENNVLKNAPHTAAVLLDDNWDKSYSRKKAAYPLEWLENNKYWVSVGRVDNAYGDRNLVCSCAPIEDFLEPELAS